MNDLNPENPEYKHLNPEGSEITAPHLHVVDERQIYDLYVSRRFLNLLGDLIVAAVLSYLVRWTPYSKDPDGWIYVSYISEDPNTQTICDDLRISRGYARKAIDTLQKAGLLQKKSKRVAGNGIKRMHFLVNQEHPEIAAELAEHEQRRAKRKRRKSDSSFRKSRGDVEQSGGDFSQSGGDFDLCSNKITTSHSTRMGQSVCDADISDIELIHQWLRTINPDRTKSDAIAYIERRLIDGKPSHSLASRLDDLRAQEEKKIQPRSSSNNEESIAQRRNLHKDIIGGAS